MESKPKGVCVCPCHVASPVLHPLPCCTLCPQCHLGIAAGVAHECLGRFHRATLAARLRALVHRLTKLDLAFSALVAVLVMALAVFSLPLQGALVLVAAAGVGVALGVCLIAWRTANRDSTGGPPR